MKKIGFVDYYLGEWHADNYPKWIALANKTLGTDYTVAYAWSEEYVSPINNVNTDQWCAKNKVDKCETLKELCEKSDAIIVLAPSNPEKHLEYAKAVLPYGKPTYIDKTFAENLLAAEEIFKLSRKHQTPFFSTSALRFAEELSEAGNLKNLIITGGGSNFAEYIIHTVEMAVISLNEKVLKCKVEQSGANRICRIKTKSNEAVIIYSPALKFSICGEKSNGEFINKPISSDFFGILLKEIIAFFESGKPPFESKHTLEVMCLRDGILKAERMPDSWIEL